MFGHVQFVRENVRGYGRAASNPPRSGRSTRYPSTPGFLSVNGSFCDPYLPLGECPCETLNSQGQLRALLPRRIFVRIVTALTVLVVCFFGTGSTALGDDNRIPRQQREAKSIICKVFGPYCQEALRVSWCESRWYIWAQNGQYLGLFQMGTYARSKYGHGSGAWKQTRAAFRYFVDSGKDWSPWSCQP